MTEQSEHTLDQLELVADGKAAEILNEACAAAERHVAYLITGQAGLAQEVDRTSRELEALSELLTELASAVRGLRATAKRATGDLVTFLEWLDEKAVIKKPDPGDYRTYEDIASEYVYERVGPAA